VIEIESLASSTSGLGPNARAVASTEIIVAAITQ